MNQQQAKEILAIYRPGTADAADPDFAEALRFCEHDPELKRWFDAHCDCYAALRARFRQVPVPEGLKEQILAERKIHTTPVWRRPAVLAVVAVIAVLTGIITSRWPTPREAPGYGIYQEQMTGTALRGYSMDMETNDPAQIRAYLARNGAPADYALTAPLRQTLLTGCAIKTWQGAKVSMICFRSGKPLAPGEKSDLWLFVINRTSVLGAPIAGSPFITPVNRAITASWSLGDKTYLLVTDGDADLLRKFL